MQNVAALLRFLYYVKIKIPIGAGIGTVDTSMWFLRKLGRFKSQLLIRKTDADKLVET